VLLVISPLETSNPKVPKAPRIGPLVLASGHKEQAWRMGANIYRSVQKGGQKRRIEFQREGALCSPDADLTRSKSWYPLGMNEEERRWLKPRLTH
jgi:hypothetical protein